MVRGGTSKCRRIATGRYWLREILAKALEFVRLERGGEEKIEKTWLTRRQLALRQRVQSQYAHTSGQ